MIRGGRTKTKSGNPAPSACTGVDHLPDCRSAGRKCATRQPQRRAKSITCCWNARSVMCPASSRAHGSLVAQPVPASVRGKARPCAKACYLCLSALETQLPLCRFPSRRTPSRLCGTPRSRWQRKSPCAGEREQTPAQGSGAVVARREARRKYQRAQQWYTSCQSLCTSAFASWRERNIPAYSPAIASKARSNSNRRCVRRSLMRRSRSVWSVRTAWA